MFLKFKKIENLQHKTNLHFLNENIGVLEFVAPTSLGLPARNATDSSWKLGSSSSFCTANCLLKKEKHSR